MIQYCRFVLPLFLVCAAAPATAQVAGHTSTPWESVDGFPAPLYLVVCVPAQSANPCPADGMALVPDPALYTNLALRVVGGPFTQRWQVENMRASLVRQGMPTHSMYIFVVDRSGATVGGFWMGAKPTCRDRHERQALTGNVSGDFSPTGARPEAMPVTENAYAAYVEYGQGIEAECRERQRDAAVIDQGGALGEGPDAAVGDEEPAFEWDTRVRNHVVECFGGQHIETYFDFYFLNGRQVGADRSEYDRVRARGLASGGQWCGSWAVREERSGPQ